MVGRGRGDRGAAGRDTPIKDVGDQGVASQTQQGVDRSVTSCGRRTQQGAGHGNPIPLYLRPIVGLIHKVFDTVRITKDDMKVSFASYQLVGKANEWWESIKEAKGVNRGMTWVDFESTFEDQYFPKAYLDEHRDQFKKLVQ
ncbi:hypothetical protein Acr_07g0012890 [Actinidia rufa]|uniref:Retrotransposon gag domain-containing protein n=1 Tax=Actinidia rufa TaxID=165716 RepID=A0A7J0EXH5_9ERIC|nr:hypothetical protein Acr_07g0012890 [Actinidia rufa]